MRKIKSNKYEHLKINARVEYFGGETNKKMNDNISNEWRELILEKGEREFFMDININCLIFSLTNEFRFDLYVWVPIISFGKVSDGWIGDLGFDSCLHQKPIDVLSYFISNKRSWV